MKLKYSPAILAILIAIGFAYGKQFNPPATPVQITVDTLFGYSIVDPYRWLENKDDPKVKEWSKAQSEFTLDYIRSTTRKIEGLSDEIRNYLQRDYKSAPFFKANREFFFARKKDSKQNKVYTKIKSKEILLFDPEAIDKTGKTSISGFVLNNDATKAAVSVQTQGSEITTTYFIDTKTGKQIAPPLANTYSVSWCRDDNYLYVRYRSKEDIVQQKPLPIYLHRLGTEPTADKLIYSPKDAKYYVDVWDDEDSEITFFSEGDFYSRTLRIKTKDGDWKEIYSSEKYTASPVVRNNNIYFFTNHEAPNYKIMVTSIDQPEFQNWRVLIPEQEYPIQSFAVSKDYIFVQIKIDVLSRLYVYNLNGEFIKELTPPELGNISSISYYNTKDELFVNVMDFTSPAKLYKISCKTLTWELVFKDVPPINTDSIESKLVFYTSKDGTRVPMFIVYKKGTRLDGNNPTILYGYGGFNIGMYPHYIGVTASFINRGGVYAVACLRGGNEYGENWHRAGMLHNKQNVFDDFISAAEYLIAEGWTNPNRLAIRGGSNGGLLVAAVAVQRPDLFKAVFCGVPLIDMIRYHKFLIARFWIPEYGDPDKEEDFKYLLKYSPYHNVRFGMNLPTMLIKTGENDTRVDPLHAKKFAALLQNLPTQINPVLLLIDFESGHGSGQSIDQMVFNIEIEFQWLMNQLGM